MNTLYGTLCESRGRLAFKHNENSTLPKDANVTFFYLKLTQ